MIRKYNSFYFVLRYILMIIRQLDQKIKEISVLPKENKLTN